MWYNPIQSSLIQPSARRKIVTAGRLLGAKREPRYGALFMVQIPSDMRSRIPRDALRSLLVWYPGPLYTQSHSESSSLGFLHLSPLYLPCVKPAVSRITLTQTCTEELDLNEWLRVFLSLRNLFLFICLLFVLLFNCFFHFSDYNMIVSFPPSYSSSLQILPYTTSCAFSSYGLSFFIDCCCMHMFSGLCIHFPK